MCSLVFGPKFQFQFFSENKVQRVRTRVCSNLCWSLNRALQSVPAGWKLELRTAKLYCTLHG